VKLFWIVWNATNQIAGFAIQPSTDATTAGQTTTPELVPIVGGAR